MVIVFVEVSNFNRVGSKTKSGAFEQHYHDLENLKENRMALKECLNNYTVSEKDKVITLNFDPSEDDILDVFNQIEDDLVEGKQSKRHAN